jgi:hypothetical protein
VPPRIRADFNASIGSSDENSTLVNLEKMGALRDLSAAGIHLSVGLELILYTDSDEDSDLEVEAIVRWVPHHRGRFGRIALGRAVPPRRHSRRAPDAQSQRARMVSLQRLRDKPGGATLERRAVRRDPLRVMRRARSLGDRSAVNGRAEQEVASGTREHNRPARTASRVSPTQAARGPGAIRQLVASRGVIVRYASREKKRQSAE